MPIVSPETRTYSQQRAAHTGHSRMADSDDDPEDDEDEEDDEEEGEGEEERAG